MPQDSREEHESAGEWDALKLLLQDEIDDPLLHFFTGIREPRTREGMMLSVVQRKERKRRVMKIDEKAFCGERNTGHKVRNDRRAERASKGAAGGRERLQNTDWREKRLSAFLKHEITGHRTARAAYPPDGIG